MVGIETKGNLYTWINQSIKYGGKKESPFFKFFVSCLTTLISFIQGILSKIHVNGFLSLLDILCVLLSLIKDLAQQYVYYFKDVLASNSDFYLALGKKVFQRVCLLCAIYYVHMHLLFC